MHIKKILIISAIIIVGGLGAWSFDVIWHAEDWSVQKTVALQNGTISRQCLFDKDCVLAGTTTDYTLCVPKTYCHYENDVAVNKKSYNEMAAEKDFVTHSCTEIQRSAPDEDCEYSMSIKIVPKCFLGRCLVYRGKY